MQERQSPETSRRLDHQRKIKDFKKPPRHFEPVKSHIQAGAEKCKKLCEELMARCKACRYYCDALLNDCQSGNADNKTTQTILSQLDGFSVIRVFSWILKSGNFPLESDGSFTRAASEAVFHSSHIGDSGTNHEKTGLYSNMRRIPVDSESKSQSLDAIVSNVVRDYAEHEVFEQSAPKPCFEHLEAMYKTYPMFFLIIQEILSPIYGFPESNQNDITEEDTADSSTEKEILDEQHGSASMEDGFSDEEMDDDVSSSDHHDDQKQNNTRTDGLGDSKAEALAGDSRKVHEGLRRLERRGRKQGIIRESTLPSRRIQKHTSGRG